MSDSANAPSIGLGRFNDEFLESLRQEGDEPADRAVRVFFEAADAPGSALYPMLARAAGAPLTDEEAPGVGPFVRMKEPWPSWTEPTLVTRGQDLFGDWGMQLASGLFLASLPMSYACAKGAEPLVRTARMTKSPKRRILETGQMIIEVMSPRSLEPGARGYAVARHVRVMHAAVRHTLTDPEAMETIGGAAMPAWDESLGVPLNQEDLLGTLLAFSVLGVRSLRQVGVKLSDLDAESYVHTWNLVGHQMGIREDLLPLNYADGAVVADRIFKSQSERSEAGRELTATTIGAMQELLKTKLLAGLPASGIRFFLGEDTADLLGVPPGNWTRSLFSAMRHVDAPIDKMLSWLPGKHSLSSAIGRRVVTGLEDVERGHGRPRFEITDELRQAWGIKAP
ncbi:MAG TPA: oxygenase MpaB family protein [Acidimicrobiales bacterium]|nr:oxygenase MpaB family protein [Acidimicrobiales bacterium]